MIRLFLLGSLAFLPLSASAQTRVSIPQIQGTSDVSPLVRQTVSTSGTVTAIFPELRGFYLQDARGDGDAKTSDGAFVYLSARGFEAWPTFKVGDFISVSGRVEEFHGQTQIGTVSALSVVEADAEAIKPTRVSLPLPLAAREAFEGMLVQIQTPLFVSNLRDLKRYGSLGLSSGGRAFVRTNQTTGEDDPRVREVLLDDGSSKQNPKPVPFLDIEGTRRAGSEISNLTGILGFDFGQFRVLPTSPVEFKSNPRPLQAPEVGGNVRVASANLHNYWTTLKNAQNPDARGASTPLQFESQSAKIVAMLRGLNADAVALMELESGETAIDDLVVRLNKSYGQTEYAKVPLPATGLGDDRIRVGMIYKPAKLRLVGNSQSATDAVFERAPLAQTFAPIPGAGTFTLVANHWKSKGSAPDEGDVDAGQGAWNQKRGEQAKATLAFVESLKQPNVLLVGDLNAYGEESPIQTLRAAGMKHLNLRLRPEERYSFAYDGKFGSLDHAFASPSLDALVTGFAEWHINADEPEFQLEQSLGTPFRASDHDPFLVGIEFSAPKFLRTRPMEQGSIRVGRPKLGAP